MVTASKNRNTTTNALRTKKNGKAWDITKKHLKSVQRLREKQKKYALPDENGKRGGPKQDAINLQERLTMNHEVVILAEGQAGLVRDMSVPFQPRHGEANLNEEQKIKKRRREKDRKARGQQIALPEHSMLNWS